MDQSLSINSLEDTRPLSDSVGLEVDASSVALPELLKIAGILSITF